MFARRPGTIRPTDLDGEEDPPIAAIPQRQTLTDDNGAAITDENGEPIYIYL